MVHHHWQLSLRGACSRSKVPIAPMGKLLTHLPQLLLAQLRPTLRSTSGCTCCRDLQKFPSPRWEFLLTCPNRLSSFNSDRYLVLSGICTCQPHLQTSHRPDGILTCFALVLAGGRCVHHEWHSELLIVRHHWQYSLQCACSRSNFPSPRWETHILLVVCRAAVSLFWAVAQ